jgi:serine protease inhibitor
MAKAWLLLLLGTGCAAGRGATPAPAPAMATAPGAGESRFAARLFGQLRAEPANLFFSPTSIRTALALATAGARGETAAQLRAAAALPDGEAAHEELGAQQQRWAGFSGVDAAAHPGIVLRVANRLWGQSGRPFLPATLALLRDRYRAPLAEVDFAADPEAARRQINGWVDQETAHKIPELLGPDTIRRITGLVLTNAIYMKAEWQFPFLDSATHSEPFHRRDGDEPVQLMHQTEGFAYAAVDGYQLLELPYRGGELVMDVILPPSADALPRLEQQLVDGALPGWLRQLDGKHKLVEVALPRFHARSQLELIPALRALGAVLPMETTADFSGFDGTRQLYIGVVAHEAVVDVGEKGTEAAAATGIVKELTSLRVYPVKPIVFRADHPFIYLIRDRSSNAILFLGRLADP